MSAEIIQILIATYPDTPTAKAKLQAVQQARANQGMEVIDAAVVRRDAHNRLRIHETEDVTGARGATFGGILGGGLGLIAGPGGIVVGAAVGALVGGATAHAFDTGIPHKRLAEIGSALTPAQTALVVLTDRSSAAFLRNIMSEPGVEVLTETMNAEAARQMGHAHDVAIRALTLGEALAEGGMASPTDEKPI